MGTDDVSVYKGGMAWSVSDMCLPRADEELVLRLSRVREGLEHRRLPWGDARAFGTPNYWIGQYWLAFGSEPMASHGLGNGPLEETVACILCGYGTRAEIGLAAFTVLQQEGLLSGNPPERRIEEVLRRPLEVQARPMKYRFPRQRARMISSALNFFWSAPVLPRDPRRLRTRLQEIHGVGPKTASLVVRNLTASNDVAVIDAHIYNAGCIAGVFSSEWTLPIDYDLCEIAFLEYAKRGGVPASGLDLVIWDQMRRLSRPTASLLELPRGVSVRTLFPMFPLATSGVAPQQYVESGAEAISGC